MYASTDTLIHTRNMMSSKENKGLFVQFPVSVCVSIILGLNVILIFLIHRLVRTAGL